MHEEKRLPARLYAVLHIVEIALLLYLVWNVSASKNPWEGIYADVNEAVVEVDAPVDAGLNSSGSGFIFQHPSGRLVIVTCGHVVGDATRANVTFYDHTTARATVAAISSDPDLALLDPARVDFARFPSLKQGSSGSLRIGDEVMTIGRPRGQPHHISIGFYSGLIKRNDGPPLLRLSMGVDPGNSGGLVVDRSGAVVGVVSAKVPDSANVAFAVPIEDINRAELKLR